MTTADQLAIVNKLLQPPEEAHTLAQVSLSPPSLFQPGAPLSLLRQKRLSSFLSAASFSERLVFAKTVRYYN